MKKLVLFVSLFTLVSSASFAEAVRVGPDADRAARREEMKLIKQKMRQQEASAPKTNTPSKWGQFWAKEGERSGLGQSGNGASKFFQNLNPAPFFKNQQERYEQRKAAAGNKAA